MPTPDVALPGVLGSNRRLAHDVPRANPRDVVDLAQATVRCVPPAHGEAWRDAVRPRRQAVS